MRTKLVLTALAVFSLGTIKGDSVLDWNLISANAIIAAGRPAGSATLDFAVVQAAVHDTVQAYQKRFEPYAIDIIGATGSMDAAVATATRDVLVNRFPSQTAAIDLLYNPYIASHGGAADPGISVGAQAAAAMIALRAGDGSFPISFPDVFGGTDPGEWRPTISYKNPPFPPPSNLPMATPWMGTVTPFAILSGTQFRPGPPPALNSTPYRKDYDEVKALGRDTGSARTPGQTAMALFWSDNLIALWNRGLRSISQDYLSDSGDIARLFALAFISAADAVITVWDSKLHYMYWRPVTAIQNGDNDGNPDTVGDPSWTPLINTPNYPDYTSGANGLSGAITRTLRQFFHGQPLDFTLSSFSAYQPSAPQFRFYHRIDDAADEVVEARMLLGIHFRTADVVGREQGRECAKWAFKHVLRPLHGHDDGDDD